MGVRHKKNYEVDIDGSESDWKSALKYKAQRIPFATVRVPSHHYFSHLPSTKAEILPESTAPYGIAIACIRDMIPLMFLYALVHVNSAVVKLRTIGVERKLRNSSLYLTVLQNEEIHPKTALM
ncbi:hypothetical protein AVEN_76704-1 [Araneus ventricosus]|uniref:Uncharacterized protein n=1 Tax=Araneus ventricosus TaxID=182803 RepID=A0A4Y2BPW9_ARAVE|nr:hypothetical protein AVEN_76704-1 [Araneus ventricosus]